MKAIVYEKNGPPDVLEYRQVDDPVLDSGQVLIRTKAISIEGGDLIARATGPLPTAPHIGGYQRAGIVDAIGEGVQGVELGQRVVGFNWSGACAELSAVPAHFVYPIPDGMSFEEAVIIPVTFGTAAQAILNHCGLSAGETVLITGATGGVGVAAVQLAKSVGATVIGTGSSDRHLQCLKDFGMDYGINYKTDNVGKICRKITGGKGVDLAMDNVGGDTIASILSAMRIGGRISVVGIVGDPVGSSFPSMGLIGKQLSAKGTFFGMDMHTREAHEMIDEIMVRVNNGELSMPIDSKFPLAKAAEAHRYIENNRVFGRVVLTAE